MPAYLSLSLARNKPYFLKPLIQGIPQVSRLEASLPKSTRMIPPLIVLLLLPLMSLSQSKDSLTTGFLKALASGDLASFDTLTHSEADYMSALMQLKKMRMSEEGAREFISDSALKAISPDMRRQAHQDFTALVQKLVQFGLQLKEWELDSVNLSESAHPSTQLFGKYLPTHTYVLHLSHADLDMEVLLHTLDFNGERILGISDATIYPENAESPCDCYRNAKRFNDLMGKAKSKHTLNRHGLFLEDLYRHCMKELDMPDLDLKSLEEECE